MDSGYSNHMTVSKELFQELDEILTQSVRLGNNKELKAAGKGSVVFETGWSKVRLLRHAHILLRVGQLLATGYNVLFDDK